MAINAKQVNLRLLTNREKETQDNEYLRKNRNYKSSITRG